jgi:hypothetical protein
VLAEQLADLPQQVVWRIERQLVTQLGTEVLAEEPAYPLTGVGRLIYLNQAPLSNLNRADAVTTARAVHQLQCEVCQAGEPCAEMEDIVESECGCLKVVADGPITFASDGAHADDSDLIIKIDDDNGIFEVIASPVVERHDLCSIAFPMKADLQEKGMHACFALPVNFRRQPTAQELEHSERSEDARDINLDE